MSKLRIRLDKVTADVKLFVDFHKASFLLYQTLNLIEIFTTVSKIKRSVADFKFPWWNTIFVLTSTIHKHLNFLCRKQTICNLHSVAVGYVIHVLQTFDNCISHLIFSRPNKSSLEGQTLFHLNCLTETV